MDPDCSGRPSFRFGNSALVYSVQQKRARRRWIETDKQAREHGKQAHCERVHGSVQ